jgi:hypothetical protein
MKKIVMRFDKSKQKNNINKTNGGLNETIEIWRYKMSKNEIMIDLYYNSINN